MTLPPAYFSYAPSPHRLLKRLLLFVVIFSSLILVSCSSGNSANDTDVSSDPPSLATPVRVEVGDDPTEVFVQFTAKDVVTQNGKTEKIWTRSYGLEEGVGLLPGPTFYFKGGDLLQMTLNNLLSDTRFDELANFEQLEATDSELQIDVGIHAKGEVNIPHNVNNTNLHTHGLHVDPSHDDVFLIVLPEGDSAENYDSELLPIIREQVWPYQYRIPDSHVPGTHWYHAHKHGSTSAHVENGMAGALVIQPADDANAIIPGLDPEQDRVLMLQLIANFGLQAGASTGGGSGGGDSDSSDSGLSTGDPFVTVNGDHQPQLSLRPNQLQRWRLINAAANHKSFSYVWLGRAAGQTEDGKSQVIEIPMLLVAIDGIPLKQSVEVTSDNPIFLGPGNRADVVVSLPEGEYALYKNYPDDIVIVNGGGVAVNPSATDSQIANPYLLTQTSTDEPSFAGLKVSWMQYDQNAAQTTPDDCVSYSDSSQLEPAPCTPIVPLLRVSSSTTADNHVLGEIDYDLNFPTGRWQPIPRRQIGGAGGSSDDQFLFTVVVSGEPIVGPVLNRTELDKQLARISPTGATASNVPNYVSQVSNEEILQSRTVVFDISGISALVDVSDTETTTVRQFTLNGRQFELGDSIGNSIGKDRVSVLPSEPDGIGLNYLDRANRWVNTYWSNPGYYSDIEVISGASDPNAAGVPVYGYAQTTAQPTIEDVTGLVDAAIVNPISIHAPAVGTPGLPVATTAEEWILINNSAVGHPFHIHINPFFITEIGQLSYETFADGQGWAVRTINPDPQGIPTDASSMNKPSGVVKLLDTSNMWWVVNSWWDTIVVPPHGYVKMRYRINVPEQSSDNSTIADNVNRTANWVYHCHILRHEDRGMMMIVETQSKATPAP